MNALACRLAVALGAALGAGGVPPAAAQQGGAETAGDVVSMPRALASNGAIVAMPEISGLDCPGMAEVLGLLDQSRYRGTAPVPEGDPDREIFEYEHRLAAAYYHACIMSGRRLDDPARAFNKGFEKP